MTPVVSIVVGVRNGAKTLRTTIESILQQSFQEWELIIADDASRDDSFAIINEYANRDQRIKGFRNENWIGLAGVLNQCINLAKGSYIARLDADDEALPERLQQQVNYLESNPKVDVIGGGAELISLRREYIGNILQSVNHSELAAKIYLKNPFIHSTVMMRKDFLKRVGGYNQNFIFAQDYELWLRTYQHFRFSNLPYPVVRYRLNVYSYERARYSCLARIYGAKLDGRWFSAVWYSLREGVALLSTKIGVVSDFGLRPNDTTSFQIRDVIS